MCSWWRPLEAVQLSEADVLPGFPTRSRRRGAQVRVKVTVFDCGPVRGVDTGNGKVVGRAVGEAGDTVTTSTLLQRAVLVDVVASRAA